MSFAINLPKHDLAEITETARLEQMKEVRKALHKVKWPSDDPGLSEAGVATRVTQILSLHPRVAWGNFKALPDNLVHGTVSRELAEGILQGMIIVVKRAEQKVLEDNEAARVAALACKAHHPC